MSNSQKIVRRHQHDDEIDILGVFRVLWQGKCLIGRMTRQADVKQTYVVRANGEIVVGNQSRSFSKSTGFDIEPGDTIVVPLHTDKVKPITLWTSPTQIVYNLAIGTAAVNSF